MDHFRFKTPDMVAGNIEKIGALFPAAITEMRGEDGQIRKGINFEVLKQLLSRDVVDDDECYEFTWVGKKAAMAEAARPITKTLRPVKEDSRDWDTTQNLYIEGDNLEVLKILRESYLGKVKMIYIDPPYNTGSDSFVYPDSYSSTKDEYDEDICLYDEDGNVRFKDNPSTNPRFHSNWCSMIYSRLTVARTFLTEDGVIFISIDDNEVDALKKICNEIFGENNFIGCAGRITKKANNQGDYWAPNFDYLLTYARNKQICPAFLGGMNQNSYNLIETDGPRKGEKYQLVRLYMSNLDPLRGCTNQRYYIECPDGTFIIPPGENYPADVHDGAFIAPKSGKDKIWRWSYQSYLEKKDQIVLKQGRSSNVVGVNGCETKWNAFTKTYLNDVIAKSTASPNSFIEDHINQNATHELKALNIPFSFAKPSSLMKYLAEVCRVGSGDIVMDFFSGSASTADSILQLQLEKGIDCHFIMVQIPENCKPESDAFKAGYKNICEIGKERIRRAGDKIKADNPLGTQNLDIGFRVFRVDESNMKDVYYQPEELDQQSIFNLVSNIKDDRTDMDLLYACLLDWGVEIHLPHTSTDLDGCTVHNVDNGALMACFSPNVPRSVVEYMAKQQPLRAVFRDSAFASDDAKINVTEIFKNLSPDTKVKVI